MISKTITAILMVFLMLSIISTSAGASAPTASWDFENKLIPDALGQGQLLSPSDVVVLENMLAVSDSGTSRVSLFDINGNFIGRFGSQGRELAGNIEMPLGLTSDGENLYIAGNPEVLSIWSVDENITLNAVQAVPTDGTAIGPRQAALDGDGNIYVICGPNHHDANLPYRILKYNSVGQLQAEASTSTFDSPAGLAIVGSYVYVTETDPSDPKIMIYNLDMTAAGSELELPENTTPGDIDSIGNDLYVSVSSFTGGINGVIKYCLSPDSAVINCNSAPVYTQIVNTEDILAKGMLVEGIDVDEQGNVYLATASMMWSASGQVLVYDINGNRTLSFPEQIELRSIWGLDHENDTVYMLPITFDGSPASILTANIDGTELEELVELENAGGSSLSIDDAGHIWYNQMNPGGVNFELMSSGVHVLDMDGNELYSLVSYNTSLTQDPATGKTITNGTRDLHVPTCLVTSTEDGKHYVYIADSSPVGWFAGGSAMVTKLEYETDPWNFKEIWATGSFIESEPTRDLSQDPAGPEEFSLPCSMVLHPDGDVLYVVDGVYWRVAMLDPVDGSWIGEFEAPLLPENATRYSESLAHTMSETPGNEEELLFPVGVDVDSDSGLVYVSYHGGSGANVYTKTGEYVGHVGGSNIDKGGIIASLSIDIVPTDDSNKKHVVIGDAHGWSLASYGVTTSEDIPLAPENEKVGVLVVAHGSSDASWCDDIRDTVENVNLPYPIEIGFLEMVSNETIPDAVDKLDAQGVTKIVALPMFVSSNSGHIEEIKYILGLIDTAPEEGLVRVDTGAEIIFADAMDDHSFIAQVLADKASGLTENAKNETVVLVLHGTTDDGFEGWNQSASSLAGKVKLILRYSMGINIEDVKYSFINVGSSNTEYNLMKVRSVVENVSATSHPIVVPIFVGEGYYTDTKIPGLLDGQDYEYPSAGNRSLLPHESIEEWVEVTVSAALPYPEISIYDSGKLLNLSIDNIHLCLCGASAYRSALEALADDQMWEEIPERGNVKIISSHPSDGHKDTFLYILDNQTEDYIINAPEGTNETNIRLDNYVYTFIEKSTGDSVTLKVKDGIPPERMFDLRTKCNKATATSEERKAFNLFKEIMQERMMYSPADEVFEVNTTLSEALVIYPGWNFISVPFEMENSDIDNIFLDLEYDALLYYNTSESLWEQGNVDFMQLEPLKGYWIKSTAKSAQFVSKNRFEQKVPSVPPSRVVHEGWNAIGYTDGRDILSAELTLSSIDDAYTTIKGPYDPATMTYEKVGHNDETGAISGVHVGTDVFEMAPYEGFWILVTKDKMLYGF